MAESAIDRVLRLVKHLPGVAVSPHYGRPALKVAGKAFAGTPRVEGALWTSCPVEMKAALIDARPDFYFDTDHFSGWPAILVRVDAIDDDSLAARLEAAWAQKAPKRLLKQGESGAPAGG